MPPKVARPHASTSHSMPLPSHPRDTPQSTSSAGRKRCSDSKRDEDADAVEPPKKHKVKVGARASIACITCRKRKVRCSGEWPSCVFCTTRSLSCVYEGHPGEFGGPTCGSGAPFGLATLHQLQLADIDPILPAVDVMLEALACFFMHHYDTFNFLHRPTLNDSIINGTVSKELMCCILAFAGRFSPLLQASHTDTTSSVSEHYAALAAQVLTRSVRPSPPTGSATEPDVSLLRCQCFLILGMFECTEDGAEQKGWMKIGTAIRMAQVLRLGFEDEDEGVRATMDAYLSESRRRTYWSCFLLDRTLSDGKERPTSLRAPISSNLRLPGSDVDYLSGVKSQGARFDADPAPWSLSTRFELRSLPEPDADLYGQTLRVGEIWQGVQAYFGSGGRNIDRRAPWTFDSTFASLQRQLDAFDARLPSDFRYTEAGLIAHSMIGQGRLFGMLHLLFACSTLVLHRDYLPFLPTLDYKGSDGPIDGEPLWNASAPPAGWWQDSLNVAFTAASVISDLLTLLAQHGSQITHPFAGYAALMAGTMHAHLKYWPQSAPAIENAGCYLDQDLGILLALKHGYPLATYWHESLSKLSLHYSNRHLGVIDYNSSKIRSSVIKMIRTVPKEEEDEGQPPSLLPPSLLTGNGSHQITRVQEEPGIFHPQFVSEGLESELQETLNRDAEYPVGLLPTGMNELDWWGHWSDFSLLGLEGERTSVWAS